MLTDEQMADIRAQCALLGELKSDTDEDVIRSRIAVACVLARYAPDLLAEIERLRGLIAEVYPQHYGMLCELWGGPGKWPTYGAAGAVLHEKMRKELGYGEVSDANC